MQEEEEDYDVEEDEVEEENRSPEQEVVYCCASLRNQNAHGHFTRAREAHFVRACAVEMHMDISQNPFVWKFQGSMPDPNPVAHIL